MAKIAGGNRYGQRVLWLAAPGIDASELRTGSVGVKVGTAVLGKASQLGPSGFVAAAGANAIKYPNSHQYLAKNIGTQWSTIVVASLTSGSASNGQILSFPASEGSWVSPFLDFGIQLNASLGSAGAGSNNWATGTTTNTLAFPSPASTQIWTTGTHTFGTSWNGSLETVYMDGVSGGALTMITSGGVFPTKPTFTGTPGYLFMGGASQTGQSTEGTVYLVAVINGALTAADMQILAANPWQLLEQWDDLRDTFGSIAASPNATVNLTGVSATSSVKSVTPTILPTITGVSATSSVGSVTPTILPTVTGVSATSSVGSLSIILSPNISLSGVSATSSVGTVTPTDLILVGGSAPDITVPTLIATGYIVSGSTHPATTVDTPAGSLIVVYLGNEQLNSDITGLTDSAGNPYTKAIENTITTNMFNSSLWYCSNTPFDLPSGGTFTVAPGSFSFDLYAYAVTNANGGLDATNQIVQTSGSTSTSLSTGALSIAKEIVFTAIAFDDFAPLTFVEGAGFTTLPTGSGIQLAYQIVNATTSVTYAPSWSNNAKIAAVIASFEHSGPANGVVATGAVGTITLGVATTGVVATSSVGTITIPSGDATVNLSGVTATSSVNSVTPTILPTMTGVSATGSVRSVTPTILPTITGVVGTSAVGSVTPTILPTITGVSATGSVRSVTPTILPTVSGVTATTTAGSATVSLLIPVTGVTASGTVASLQVISGTVVNPSGVSATSSVGSVTITIDTTVALSGVAATASVSSLQVIATSNVFVPGLPPTGGIGALVIVYTQIIAVPGLPPGDTGVGIPLLTQTAPPTSGTFLFDLTYADIILQAYAMAGFFSESLATHDMLGGLVQINLILSEWMNEITMATMTDLQIVPLAMGQQSFQCPVGTDDVLVLVVNRNSYDLAMERISVGEYTEIVNKTAQGLPSQYYVQRTPYNVTVWLWQTSNVATDVIKYYRKVNLQDAVAFNNVTGLRPNWIFALICNLAVYVAGMRKAPPGVVAILAKKSETAFANACSGECEDARLMVEAWTG